MFAELKRKYGDIKRTMGETAIIYDIETGFSWAEITGAGMLVLVLLLFTLGFVIGPQLTGSAQPDVGTAPSDGGEDTQSAGADAGDDGGESDGGDGTGGDETPSTGSEDTGSSSDDGASDEAESDGSTAADGFNRSTFERAVHDFVNRERQTRNRTPLTWSSALREAARTHSDRMARRANATHTIPSGFTFRDRYETLGIDLCASDGDYSGGQNIAKTFFDVQLGSGDRFADEGALASHVVDAWMEGDATADVVVSTAYRHEAIGARYVPETGAVYVTQNLC